MSEHSFETEDGGFPLRRSTRARRGMRTGPLRALAPRSASSLPLALIAMLAAAGSAAAFITTQPGRPIVDDAPTVELAAREPAAIEPVFDAPAVTPAPETPVVAQLDEVQPQAPAPILELAPAPVEPVRDTKAAFGLDSLPVLEADETSLGIDDALDALSAPVTPQGKPTLRRNTAAIAARPARAAY